MPAQGGHDRKGGIFSPRHCEAQPKQSRHKRWIAASRTALLAMTGLAIFSFSSLANAMSQCPEKYTFEYNLERADIVAEVQLEKFDLVKYEAVESGPRFNFNQKHVYFLTEKYIVDKAWKNSRNGEEISMFFCMPPELSFYEAKGLLAALHADKKRVGSKAILLINDDKDTAIAGSHNSCDCETGSYKLEPGYKAALQKKFPKVATE